VQNWKTTYWTLFNMLGRVVGICFAVVGGGFCLHGAAQRDWIIAAVGAVVAGLGILLAIARPSRPPGSSEQGF